MARRRGLGASVGASLEEGRRQCELAGCSKASVSGGTPHCKAHGGGKRCQEEGCTKSAQGDTGHCVSHGGGKRCQEEGCFKAAAGSLCEDSTGAAHRPVDRSDVYV
jgi:hypothetical protein